MATLEVLFLHFPCLVNGEKKSPTAAHVGHKK